MRIHAITNRATQAVLERLMETIDELAKIEGRVTVAVVTDLLVVNEVRLVVDSQSMGPVLFILEELKKRNVEEIDIAPTVTVDELGRFLRCSSPIPPRKTPSAFSASSSPTPVSPTSR